MNCDNLEEKVNWACPICHGNKIHMWRLGLAQCENCDGIFSPDIFHKNANEQKNDEWFGAEPKNDRSFWIGLFERWNNRRTFSLLEKAGKKGGRLLEVGVGSGAFLNEAKKKGFEVTGCDLSSAVCKRAEGLYNIEMHCIPLESLAPDEGFDAIVMNHVLEHVQEPEAFLKAAFDYLNPGGVVHIAVPNVACWEAKLPGWTSFEPYHLLYFTPPIFNKFLVKSGFKIVHLHTYDSFSGWFLAALRTAMGINKGGIVGRKSGSGARRAHKKLRFIWLEHAYRLAMISSGVLSWPLRLFQAQMGYGDEVVCVARKIKP